MDFTQYDLDTINLLVVSYFKNGEAKTPDDVSRVLDLVTKSRSQETTVKADPTDTFLEQIKKVEKRREKEKKFEPAVPWPEPPRRSWRSEEIGLGAAPMAYCGDPIPGNLDRDFPRTA